MKFYPIFVRLQERPCVVIGGGEVAERKVTGLLGAGARVAVVSPELTPELERLARAGEIQHRPRRYRRGDLAGAFLAYAATDDHAVNADIAAEAENQGVLLNAVDKPAFCNFIVPAVVERGDLVIATSTSGSSPMMARRIREELEGRFGPEYADALEILGALRRRLAAEGRPSEERQRALAALVDSPLLELLRAGDREGLGHLLAQTVGGGYTSDSQS
jgi:precorrin-2 dehydrogenase / sirohydrochlorin ferrochelatase